MVTHCLEDDFRSFLDRSQYVPVPLDQRPAGPEVNRVNHSGYLQRFGIEYVFNHHDVHLDPGYAYLQRCVDRYRACLADDESTVHLITCWFYEGVHDDLERLAQVLAERARASRLVAFVIRDFTDKVSTKLEVIKRDERMASYLLQPVSRWQPLVFPDFIDEYTLVHVLAAECASLHARSDAATGA